MTATECNALHLGIRQSLDNCVVAYIPELKATRLMSVLAFRVMEKALIGHNQRLRLSKNPEHREFNAKVLSRRHDQHE